MLVSILLLLAGSVSLRAAEIPLDANSLRGVWLERFTRFIDWPESHRVRDPAQPFELCVMADPPFASLLTQLYKAQPIKGKAVRVLALEAGTPPPSCDLLFLGSVAPPVRDLVVQQAAQNAMLLVSASPGYAESGSHINLYEEDGYLRFEINVDAVQHAKLAVSSHLLKIARVVRQKGGS